MACGFPYGGAGGVWGLFVSGFLAAPIMRVSASLGVVCVGCVVRGCCLRTT